MRFFQRHPKLTKVFEELREVNVRIRAPRTIENYTRAIKRFAEVVGHEPTTKDLTDTNISKLVNLLLSEGRSAPTANNYAKCIKALWRFASARGYVRSIPYAAKLPEPDPETSTWSMEEMARLFEACERQPGYIGPIRARDWWVTFHMFCWDTAERTTAVLNIEWKWVDLENASLSIPPEARKGGQKWGRYRLRPVTVAQLEQICHPEREKVFGGMEWRSFHRAYKAILVCAGLPTGRRDGPQKIRRTVATLFKAAGGDPVKLLQHVDPRVTEKSYMDNTRLPDIAPPDVVPDVKWNHGVA